MNTVDDSCDIHIYPIFPPNRAGLFVGFLCKQQRLAVGSKDVQLPQFSAHSVYRWATEASEVLRSLIRSVLKSIQGQNCSGVTLLRLKINLICGLISICVKRGLTCTVEHFILSRCIGLFPFSFIRCFIKYRINSSIALFIPSLNLSRKQFNISLYIALEEFEPY